MTDGERQFREDEDPLRAVRIGKRASLETLGIDPYPYSFERSHAAAELEGRYAGLAIGAETEDRVRVAGRIRAMRNNGMFIDLHDASGKIQIFCHRDLLGPEALASLRLLDIGDLLGVEGLVRRTPRGELTVNASALTVLAKALRPLPEKYHGLADIELRYRQRYLDLIMNPESRETLRRRSRIIGAMRSHLVARDYLEVETPMLHAIAGGASAKPFVTHHNALDTDLYLRIAPELDLKRLLVGGLSDKLFEINRALQRGDVARANPEFTSLELYEADVDYTAMMSLTEASATTVAESVLGALRMNYGGTEIDLSPPWPRQHDRARRGGRPASIFAHWGARETAREAAAGCRRRHHRRRELGAGAGAGLRRARRGHPDPAGPCYRLSPGYISVGQSRPGRSAAGRAVRDLYLWMGDRQRLLRAHARRTSVSVSRHRCGRARRATRRRSRSTRIT